MQLHLTEKISKLLETLAHRTGKNLIEKCLLQVLSDNLTSFSVLHKNVIMKKKILLGKVSSHEYIYMPNKMHYLIKMCKFCIKYCKELFYGNYSTRDQCLNHCTTI